MSCQLQLTHIHLQDLSQDDNSLNLVGLGKLANAVPPQAWSQIVDSACTTFRQILAPITATTSGVGRLIDAKFDHLVDAQKVLAANTLDSAHKKSRGSRKKNIQKEQEPKAPVIIGILEASSIETDSTLR